MTSENHDSGEEEEFFSPCFKIGPNVKLKDFPTNGEEYLVQVIKERRKYVVVTKCDEDVAKFAKNQSRFVEEPPPVISAPEGLKPTIEWQNIQVADFSEIRLYVSRMHSNKRAWPKTVKTILQDPNDKVLWKNLFQNQSPTLTCLFGLKQSYLDQGLGVLVQAVSNLKPGDSIDDNLGKWIYAFLAYLPLPLLSDTISLLRVLARKISEIRSQLNIESDKELATVSVAPLNLFICLISRYFRQWDLADQ